VRKTKRDWLRQLLLGDNSKLEASVHRSFVQGKEVLFANFDSIGKFHLFEVEKT